MVLEPLSPAIPQMGDLPVPRGEGAKTPWWGDVTTARIRHGRCMTRVRFPMVVGMAVVLATACSSGHPTPQVASAAGSAGNTPTSAPANTTSLLHNAAQCIRDHGVPNFPDPVLDAHGRIQIDDNLLKNLPAAVQQSAENACKSQINAAEQAAQVQQPAVTPQELAQLTTFAKCMRAHGFPNFPDPDSHGSFTANSPGALPSDKRNPSFQACRAQLPTRGA
jgi:hypothetical protein